MKRNLFLGMLIAFTFPLSAQWNNAGGKWVTGFYWGSDYNPIARNKPGWYQVSVRETRYITGRIGFGAEAGFTKLTDEPVSQVPLSANIFAKLRLVAGLYGEYGVGFTGVPYTSGSSKRGAYWAVGISKKLGSHLALDLQYRNAPTVDALSKNYSNGLRAGLHIKF